MAATSQPSGGADAIARIAMHEAGHAAAAMAFGYRAAAFVYTDGTGKTYVDGADAEAWRVICASGPLAELRHRWGRRLTPRAAWHAWRSGELAACCSPGDVAGMGAITRGLLARAADLTDRNWTAIRRMATALQRLGAQDRDAAAIESARSEPDDFDLAAVCGAFGIKAERQREREGGRCSMS